MTSTAPLKFNQKSLFNEVYPFSHGYRHEIIVSTNDIFMHNCISRYGEYCEGEVDVFRAIVQPADLVVNVGANIGCHTLALAELACDGTVVALEPQRIIYQALCGNVALNSLVHVDTIRAAAGRKAGMIRVPMINPYQRSNTGGLSLDPMSGGGDVTPLVRLDDLGLPVCHFMLIDVEGMEGDVLLGAQQIINKHRPALYLEYQWNRHTVADVLTQLGYQFWRHVPPHARVPNFLNRPIENEDEGVANPMLYAEHPESSRTLPVETKESLGMIPLSLTQTEQPVMAEQDTTA